MNSTIVRNWNRAVGVDDVVYFLGDLSRRRFAYWLRRLKGQIVFILGSHDRARGYNHIALQRGGTNILLIHNPHDGEYWWHSWIVHGHTHNNNPLYPLVNTRRKTVNVSAELINYTPLPLPDLMKLIQGRSG